MVEVLVDPVEIILVDHRRGAIQAGIAILAARTVPLGSAKGRRLLLCLPDQHDPVLTRRVRDIRATTSSFRCPFSNVSTGT